MESLPKSKNNEVSNVSKNTNVNYLKMRNNAYLRFQQCAETTG